MSRVIEPEEMERTLCLATKATVDNIHVCGRAVDHEGDHFDPIDEVSWLRKREPSKGTQAA